MTCNAILTALGAALLVTPPAATAQSDRTSSRAPAPGFADPDRLSKLSGAFPEVDRLMREFAERVHVPGIAYGIVVDGRVAHLGVSGLRELPTRAPVESTTPPTTRTSPFSTKESSWSSARCRSPSP